MNGGTKQALDYAMAGAAVSIPLWLESLQTWGEVVALIGGIVLLGLRIGLAIREWRSNRNGA